MASRTEQWPAGLLGIHAEKNELGRTPSSFHCAAGQQTSMPSTMLSYGTVGGAS
jgi:hypothetical protein